jgi:hypothetical protein
MPLATAIQNARHTPQQITWRRGDGSAQDLTGATLSGRIKSLATGIARAIDGTLSIVTAASGIFSWTYGTLDVGTAGVFLVQFTATYAGPTTDGTLSDEWTVAPAL